MGFRFLSALLPLAALLAAPAVAVADDCLDEVRQVYTVDLDPFARPPHHMENTVHDPDGAVIRVFDSWIETPLVSMSGVRDAGLYALVRDRDSWIGPSPDGPWTKAPNQLPDNRRETTARLHAEQAANIADAACLGTVEQEGRTWIAYRFTTRTDPDPEMDDTWFGATTTVYLDPETRLPGLYEQVDMVSKWAPEPSTERHVIRVTYDPAMSLPQPAE